MKFEYIRLGKYIKRSTINNKDEKYGTELIVGVNNEGMIYSFLTGSYIGLYCKIIKSESV